MRPLVPLRKAFADPNLLAPVMAGGSREAMRAILLASQGEALTPSERKHWRRLTGREAEPLARSEECHIIAGRRSGKTSGCAALATYASALCDYSDRLSPGERGVVLLVDLFLTHHDGKLLRLAAGGDDLVDAPPSLERDFVDKADGGHRDQDRTGRKLPISGQIKLIGSDFGRA
jgi:hypothetical protein